MPRVVGGAVLILCVLPLSLAAQKPQTQDLAQRIQNLEEQIRALQRSLTELRARVPDLERLQRLENQIEVLTEELQRLREAAAPVSAPRPQYGLGPSASRVYATQEGVSLAGYGEIVYRNTENGSTIGDAQRFIIYLGYRFSERLLFNSEIEFEHAFTEENLDGKAGEVALEFAYLDYLWRPQLNLRAGLMLVPVGIINEIHEPPTFNGVQRPDVERTVIPTTWREIGLGVFGQLTRGLQYRIFLINGLDARGFSAGGFKEGRSSGNRAPFATPALVGRLDWEPRAGWGLGLSAYVGRADQNLVTVDDRRVTVPVRMIEAHARFQHRGLEIRALYVHVWLNNIAQLNRHLGLHGASGVGAQMFGGYLEAAYHILLPGAERGTSLVPFLRYERYNTQHRVSQGFTADPTRDVTVWTIGVGVYPVTQVVLKADFQFRTPATGETVHQFNLGVGFNF